MNFMIAGRDTTACALSWTIYELLKQPHIQDKIRAEFDAVCAAQTGEADNIPFETVGELKFTHAVIMEVLRLHPRYLHVCVCAPKRNLHV